MNKTIGILVAVMICCVGSVFAAPSFSVDHNVVVTGDWKYDGGWTQGEFVTAVYDMSAVSQNSLSSFYVVPEEKLGQAWKYDLESHLGTSDRTQISTEFHAWTVNDPVSTPATGGYTRYSLDVDSYGDFSSSSISVEGKGAVDVSVYLNAQSGVQQDVVVDVN